MKYYILYTDETGNIFYERTCGAELRAKERVKELKEYHTDAYYTDKLPEKYFY